MGSPTIVSSYVAQNSKKRRVFPGTSSSRGFKEVEVFEMSPPINLASKSNSFKQKQVIHHEIIDLDLEEDRFQEIIDIDLEEDDGATAHINGNMGRNGKGKLLQSSQINLNNASISHENHFQIKTSKVGRPLKRKQASKLSEDGGSLLQSSQINLNSASISHENHFQIKTSKVGRPLKRKQASKLSEDGGSLKRQMTSQPSDGSMPHTPENKSSQHFEKRRSPRLLSKTLPSNANISSSYAYTTSSMPSTSASLTNGSAFAPVSVDYSCIQKGKTPARVEQRNVDVILQKRDLFNKFDTVEDFSDHYYSKGGSSAKRPPKNWSKRIQEEWRILEKDLPDNIFVRVYESRMDLLRAVIVGAEGTPYHDGLFFFDVNFPSSYPNVPPLVHYHSGGLRINPNLYNCGKVCLSLLNTWGGNGKEKWIPGVSTMLQVLVSIQGLILNVKPYFNEPGFANSSGTKAGEEASLRYNESTFMLSLQTMVYNMRRPPKYFEPFVVGHFYKYAREILVSCEAYLDGAQVGCLVKGGVQDVDEGDTSCSKDFRKNLANFITTLVNTFKKIGAKDCEKFLSLSKKA